MTTCIPKDIIDEVKNSGVFDIKDSLKREQALSRFFTPEYSKLLNSKFEKTKLLKDTEAGFNKFFNSQTKEGQAKLLNTKTKMKNEFNRKAQLLNELQDAGQMKDSEILNIEKAADDIFKEKYGLKLSETQTNEIITLTNEIKKSSKLAKLENGDYDLKYGLDVRALENYTSALKDPTANNGYLREIGYQWNKTKGEFTELGGRQKISYMMDKMFRIATSPAFKNMKATLDVSWLGIQGIAAFARNPIATTRAVKEAFSQIFAKHPEDAMNLFMAKMYSGARYNESIASGLRLAGREEQVISTFPEKLGWLGKGVKRADNSFIAFLQSVRFKEYNRVATNLEKSLGRKLDFTDKNLDNLINKEIEKQVGGKNLSAEQVNKIIEKVNKTFIPDSQYLKEAATHANKISGTSNLGIAEKYADGMNSFLFAGRYAVSDIRMYTDVLNFKQSSKAQMRAVETLGINLGALYGSYLALATLFPDRTEIRPNAVNFMKIKGDDYTFSYPSIKGKWVVQLMSKIIVGSEITGSGNKVKYGEGYKGKTRGDVILRTLRSKLAPTVSTATNLFTGSDYLGKENTPLNVVAGLVAPIAASDAIEKIFSDTPIKDQFMLNFLGAAGIQAY